MLQKAQSTYDVEGKQKVESASSTVRDLADAVRSGTPLTARQTANLGLFEKKFGKDSGTYENLTAVANTFDGIAAKIGNEGSGMQVVFDGAWDGFAKAGLNSDLITIGKGFLDDGRMQGFSRAFVLMHEAGHRAVLDDQLVPNDAPLVNGAPMGRGPPGGPYKAYGNVATDWLAIFHPDIARINNENFQCYADQGCGN